MFVSLGVATTVLETPTTTVYFNCLLRTQFSLDHVQTWCICSKQRELCVNKILYSSSEKWARSSCAKSASLGNRGLVLNYFLLMSRTQFLLTEAQTW